VVDDCRGNVENTENRKYINLLETTWEFRFMRWVNGTILYLGTTTIDTTTLRIKVKNVLRHKDSIRKSTALWANFAGSNFLSSSGQRKMKKSASSS
jgi:hypothetical protein